MSSPIPAATPDQLPAEIKAVESPIAPSKAAVEASKASADAALAASLKKIVDKAANKAAVSYSAAVSPVEDAAEASEAKEKKPWVFKKPAPPTEAQLKVQKALAKDVAKGMSREELAEKHGLVEKTVLSFLRYEALRRCREGQDLDEVRESLGLSPKEFIFTPQRGKKWTNEDIKYVEDNCNLPLSVLAEGLGRTETSIKFMLNKIEHGERSSEPREEVKVKVILKRPSQVSKAISEDEEYYQEAHKPVAAEKARSYPQRAERQGRAKFVLKERDEPSADPLSKLSKEDLLALLRKLMK